MDAQTIYANYLDNFNQWLEINDLPVSAQLMYFKLLHFFYKAGWPKHIQLSDLELAHISRAPTRKTAILARSKLAESGFVRFRKTESRSVFEYKLLV